MLARIVAGDVPSEAEAAEFAASARAARVAEIYSRLQEFIETDPVLRAAGAVAGDTYLMALLRLLDRLVPDVASTPGKAAAS